MNKRIIWGTILTLIFLALLFFSSVFYYDYLIINQNINVSIDEYLNDKLLYDVNINYSGNEKKLYCSIDKENWLSIDNCHYSLNPGKYKLYLKSSDFYVMKSFKVDEKIRGTFYSSLDSLDTYYLALNGKKEIVFTFDYSNDFDRSVIWNIKDNDVVSIKNNIIFGKKVGSTNVTATLKDGNSKNYKIVVTDLISPMKLNNEKEIVPCGYYSKEENELLDKILESRVKEAGVGTRGGVLAAIRFITMEFPYAIPYFYENGRLVDNGYRPHLDGEGRYYHKGLYLSNNKYNSLEKGANSKSGPKMWGCELYSSTTKKNDKNGLDCSGFVSWAMLNGGFDVGDVGAGDYKEFSDDLSDLGKRNDITKEYIENGNYKAGDFIGRNGHAALIIGIDKNNIYTAEALPPKLKVYTYDKESKIFNSSNVKYIIEMSNIYPNGDGLYTDMW